MGLKEIVIERLGAVPAERIEQERESFERVLSTQIQQEREQFTATLAAEKSRAYEAGFYDGGNDDPQQGDVKAGGMGYRRISDNYLREGEIDYQKALQTAWTLWQRNPIAARVLKMKRDHIIGHNARPSCEDTAALKVIESFWDENKLETRSSQFTMQLFGFGEQCYPAFVREADGRVRLGYIDPQNIERIVKHPENSLEDWAVVVQRFNTAGNIEKNVYRIIREDEAYVDDQTDMQPKYEGRLVTAEQAVIQPWELKMLESYKLETYSGSCFFAKVNSASNQERGMSDLLQIADWLNQGDQVLFGLADREVMASYFVWLLKMVNADSEQISKRKAEIVANPPRPGSWWVHNDSEEPTLVSPNLGQTGTIETFRAILGLCLGGMGFPVHWYGFGDDANLAIGTAQSEPTAKSLEHDQGIVKNLFISMCRFALDQAAITAAEKGLTGEYEIRLNLPEVTMKDTSRVTASLGALVQALVAAQEKGWLAEETAVTTLAKVFVELDIEIDPAEELKKAAAEKEEREQDEERRNNNALNGRLNGANGNGMNGRGNAVDIADMIKGL